MRINKNHQGFIHLWDTTFNVLCEWTLLAIKERQIPPHDFKQDTEFL